MAYDSTRDPFVRIKKYFPYFKASGTTPEGLIFQAITDKLVARQRGTDSYFVNLSDGAPHYHNLDSLAYSGNAAYDHTRSQVSKIRRMGIKVISYFIGSGQEKPFTRMYGKDARFISVENVAAIAKTMNDKFLEVS
jgi:nitric oxide reductase activation protein